MLNVLDHSLKRRQQMRWRPFIMVTSAVFASPLITRRRSPSYLLALPYFQSAGNIISNIASCCVGCLPSYLSSTITMFAATTMHSTIATAARRPLVQHLASVTSAASTSASVPQSQTRSFHQTKQHNDRIVVAVGGNALQRRGERLTIENMLKAAADMAPTIALLAQEHEVVLTHGNGPQVGELALERSAATFDVLGAESMGQIGYVLAQALSSVGCHAIPILTQVVVDPMDPAFRNPTKFVGPVYGPKEAHALAESLGWTVKADGEYFRRVVPSPPPLEILQIEAVRLLLEHCPVGSVTIACGGGGIPVCRVPARPQTLQGVEAVIDKDACGAKLALDIHAHGYIILTDGGGIWRNFGKVDAKEMAAVTPEYLKGTKTGKNFPGSMGPKIEAAIRFVENSSNPDAWAAIGDLKDAAKIASNQEGTLIRKNVEGNVIWREHVDEEAAAASKPPRQSKDPPKYG